MENKVIASVFLALVLAGCSSKKEIVPVATTPDPSALLARPPAEAMVPAHTPVSLEKGQSNSYYSGVMRQNNLYCADDRVKLTTLQKYILGIFETK